MKINLRTNNTARIYITGESFFDFPVMRFISTYEIIPRRIPFAIEYVKGIVIRQMKAGIDSEKSSNGIFFTASNISRPTIIKAGAVAAAGIDKNNGEKNNATAKHPATLRAVSPERPPCATPAALST